MAPARLVATYVLVSGHPLHLLHARELQCLCVHSQINI